MEFECLQRDLTNVLTKRFVYLIVFISQNKQCNYRIKKVSTLFYFAFVKRGPGFSVSPADSSGNTILVAIASCSIECFPCRHFCKNNDSLVTF